jgi:hypothetical protein
MMEITVMFMASFISSSPNASYDPFALQVMGWLNESFPCHSFRMVDHDAKVTIGLYTNLGEPCGKYNFSQTLGCFTAPESIQLNPLLYEPLHPWNGLRRGVVVHEFYHYFLWPNNPVDFHANWTPAEYYRRKWC